MFEVLMIGILLLLAVAVAFYFAWHHIRRLLDNRRRVMVYRDGLVTFYEWPADDEEYEEIEVTLEGLEGSFKLLDFNPFYDDDGELLAAFKMKRDSKTALYWVGLGGETLFHEFEEYVLKDHPDYCLVDMKYALRKQEEIIG